MEGNKNAIKSLSDMNHVLERGRTTTVLCAERYLNEFLVVRIEVINKRIAELDARRSEINQELLNMSDEKLALQNEFILHSKLVTELKSEIKVFI